MSELTVVGKSVLRFDSWEKVQGKGGFCGDIMLPGMLHMKILGSPYPHAKILTIDTSRAEKSTGVRCVVTDKDTPQERFSPTPIKDLTFLARGVVRYVGEPVAAVAATTLEAAEEAADRIRVEYEPLPAIFDVEEASATSPKVVVHPEFQKYVNSLPPALRAPDRPNVFTHGKVRKGDVEKGFEQADLVLENRYTAPAIHAATLEPHSIVVRPDADGGLTLLSGRQGIWGLRGLISELFGIAASKIRVKQRHLGGAFCARGVPFEYLPTLLALKTGRPVKSVFTREEVFSYGGVREDMVIYTKDGFKRDGTLTASEIKAYINGGAYSRMVSIITRRCSMAAVSMYRIPHFKWDAYGCYTHTPPRSGVRGFGMNEVSFAQESSLNIAAEKLGLDPAELRRRNLLKEGEPQLTGEITHSNAVGECMDKVAGAIRLQEKSPSEGPWRMGKGIALGNKYSTAPMLCEARIRICEDEKVTLYHSADDVGMGVNVAMAQIVAEKFGITVEDVKVVFSDTDVTPFFGDGSSSSRVTYNLGNAVCRACDDAKADLFRRAGRVLKVSPEELETKAMLVYYRINPEKRLQVKDLFIPHGGRPSALYGTAIEGGEIVGKASFKAQSAPDDPATGQMDPELARKGLRINTFFAYYAKAVEVAVNIETGEVKAVRCLSGIDLGKAINPKICEQQSEGGLMMGIGSALSEEVRMEGGNILNPNFTDYQIPIAIQMPPNEKIQSFFVESAPHKDGPYGAKGFAESTNVAVEPAIAAAVYDAVGIRIKDLPITPEKVLKALREKRTD
ncbi:MAG: xanthine dehydrogenase family protein molybdopterin-binding subunit [Thermodesulfobacteriota bacterium]